MKFIRRALYWCFGVIVFLIVLLFKIYSGWWG